MRTLARTSLTLALVSMGLSAGCTGVIADPVAKGTYTNDNPSTGDGDSSNNGHGNGDGDGNTKGGDGDGDTSSHGDGDGDTSSHGDGDTSHPTLDAGMPHGDGDGDSNTTPDAGHPDNSNPCSDGTEPFVGNLQLTKISAYQVMEVPLMQNGSWSGGGGAIPVVQGKKTMIRAFVQPQSGFSAHTVRAVLTLDNGTPKKLTAEMSPSTSSDQDLNSTFNFDVDGADIGPSTQMSVSLIETQCQNATGSASNARFPASGTQPLNAKKIGKLRLVVVPMIMNGRTADTSASQIESIRADFLAHYPVPAVEVTVHSAVQASNTIDPSGNGWDEVLNDVLNTRYNDQPEDDIYYLGLASPTSSFGSYCGGSCVTGLSPQPTQVDPQSQGSLSVGFVDPVTPETSVHEVGHAHGLGHAPCDEVGGQTGVDQNYTPSDGAIGVWGWDSRTNELVDQATKDIMSYCQPTWIGDYDYAKVVTRSAQVNVAARVIGTMPEWHSMMVFKAKNARWTARITRRMPGAELEAANVLDASGKLIDVIHVARVPLSHSDTEILYLPKPQAGWDALVINGRVISLAHAEAAR